ncbi:MAG: hypothetical protein Q8N51_16115, partial [Gammaproteobacteria bacterium]|nr:hypothetical protein [Gammaproteobacteria bacterium]
MQTRGLAWWLSFMGLLAPLWAQAHSEQILSLTITNGSGASGYLIAADADSTGAQYNRENIAAQAQIRFASTNNARVLEYQYLIEFRLLDGAGDPVAVLDAAGNTNTAYTVEQSVRLPFSLLGISITQTTRTLDAPLVPTVRLSPFEAYRVSVRIQKRPAGLGRYTLLPLTSTTSPRTYYHFTSRQNVDAALNVITTLDAASYQREYLVNTVAGREAIPVPVDFTLRRYDAPASAPSTANITVRFDYELQDAATGVPVPLVASSRTVVRAVQSHGIALFGFPIPPTVVTSSDTLSLQPASQLDPVGKQYRAVVRIAHVEVPGGLPVPANTITLPNRRLLHFNGTLLFGGI